MFNTNDDWAGFIARITLGIVLFPHGAQKMLGMFGGQGFSETMNVFTTHMELPWIVAFSTICIEFFGSIALIVGFASRVWAIAFIFLFLGIIFTVHINHGFFMNWLGNQEGEGYEYALLIIGISFVVFINGSGKKSLDKLINSKIDFSVFK